ncbi:MAG: hypothetical protein IKX86_04185 [Clostridia bacterium]|nr:hypothetical protein [Clostridia bacterium]
MDEILKTVDNEALAAELEALRLENRRLTEMNAALTDARLETALDSYVFSSGMARYAIRRLASEADDPVSEVERLVKENPDALMTEPKNCPFFSSETTSEEPERRSGWLFRRK